MLESVGSFFVGGGGVMGETGRAVPAGLADSNPGGCAGLHTLRGLAQRVGFH